MGFFCGGLSFVAKDVGGLRYVQDEIWWIMIFFFVGRGGALKSLKKVIISFARVGESYHIQRNWHGKLRFTLKKSTSKPAWLFSTDFFLWCVSTLDFLMLISIFSLEDLLLTSIFCKATPRATFSYHPPATGAPNLIWRPQWMKKSDPNFLVCPKILGKFSENFWNLKPKGVLGGASEKWRCFWRFCSP